MKTTTETYVHKASVRLTEKQMKAVKKNAKASKMNIAEYIRACIL
jgi:predicted DNA binding CopG/RHH family protein